MSDPMDGDQLATALDVLEAKAWRTKAAAVAFERVRREVLRARHMEARWRSMIEGVRALVEEEEPE